VSSGESSKEIKRLCLKSEDYHKCMRQFNLNHNSNQTKIPIRIKVRPYFNNN